jgi:hypothetical protein
VKIAALVKEQLEKLHRQWEESHERMLQRAYAALSVERREHLASRQQIHALERELEAKEAAIRANAVDPLSEAKKLLRLIDEITMPIFIRSGEIQMYELRCWKDDYAQFKKSQL